MRANASKARQCAAMVACLVLAACTGESPPPTQPITPQVTLFTPTDGTPVVSVTVVPSRANPLLVDTSPPRGEELSPNQPLRLVFDQPMDRPSVEQALRVLSDDGQVVQGALTWDSDNVVSFAPLEGWKPASRYQVTLAEQARSAKGVALAKPQSFLVNTVGNLAVAQTLPMAGAEDARADSPIVVIFNRPVVPLTALAEQAALPQPFTISPTVAGRGEWLNTSVYVFRPSEPLQAGARYEVRVPAGLQDTTGAILDVDYGWSFTVAQPVVKSFTPAPGATGVDLRAPISVTFSQPMDHESAQAAFTIEPPVRGTFRWAEEKPTSQPSAPPFLPQEAIMPVSPPPVPPDSHAPVALGEVMAFVPEEDYQRGVTYRVTLNASARAKVGSGRLRSPATTSFTVVPLPAVVSTQPTDGAVNYPVGADPLFDAFGGQIVIRFNAPIAESTILPNLRFDPPVTFTNAFSYYDTYANTFNINLNLQPSTNYEMRIGADIADRYGAKLGKETVVRFRTAPYPPRLVWQPINNVSTYSTLRPTQVLVRWMNLSRIDAQLARLSLEDFHRLTGTPNAYTLLQQFAFTDQNRLRRWSVRLDARLNVGGTTMLSIAEDGGSLPTGIYLLELSAPELAQAKGFADAPQRGFLLVNSLHLALKQGERSALVWATDLATGRPVAGVPIALYDADFNLLGQATTSGEEGQLGQALFALPEGYSPLQRLYAVAGQPGRNTFGLVSSDMSNNIEPFAFKLDANYEFKQTFAYLYTDRPLYRPGQTVFYKGMVRSLSDARYSLLQDGRSITLRILDPNGQQLAEQPIVLSANGTFDGEWVLDRSAMSGQYTLQLCIARATSKDVKESKLDPDALCNYYFTSFLVAAYRTPEFSVALTPDKAEYLDGESIQLALSAQYFFGGDVADAPVRWRLLAQPYIFDRYTGPGNYSFHDFSTTILPTYRPFNFPDVVSEGEGRTDATGRLTITLPADLSQRRSSASFTVEASLADPSDRSITARAEVLVHKTPLYFGVATDRYVYQPGEAVNAQVIAVDWQGQPLPNVSAEIVFSRREWLGVHEEGPIDTPLFTATLTTDLSGKAAISFDPPAGGEYVVRIANAATSFFVSSVAYVPWRAEDHDRIELKLDKSAYEVGEVARVLVPSPFEGPLTALLTVERGDFLLRRTVQLNSNSDVLELPITPDWAPNAFVSVLLVKGVRNRDELPAFRLGYAALTVNPREFALDVQITSDRPTYAPRDVVTYDVRVTDSTGQPVQAELSLALVDKAVWSLLEPNAEPILEAFYGTRGLSVRTADSLVVNQERTMRLLATYKTLAEGGAGGEGAQALALDESLVRRDFRDTAAWRAAVTTDPDGRARVSFPLPDNLTTWVLEVKAVTAATQVGEGKHEIVVTKPVLIRPVVPRFLVAGDTLTIGAVVNNNTESELVAQVGLVSTNLLLISREAIQELRVPAKGTARANWQVQVQNAALSHITFTVRGAGFVDSAVPGLRLADGEGIPILRYAAPEVIGTSGELSTAEARVEQIVIPPRLRNAQADLSVQVDAGLGALALSSARALEEREDDSVHWIASRLLVELALARARNQPPQALPLNLAVQRLRAAQRFDGGWGWWPEDERSNPAVTAYALVALGEALQQGVLTEAIVGDMLRRAAEYLTRELQSLQPFDTDPSTAAWYAFALSYTSPSADWALPVLVEKRENLSYAAQAWLALALARQQPDEPRVRTLLSDLRGAANTSATGTFWQERSFSYAIFDSNTRTTAFALLALARLTPQDAALGNIVRWLITARRANSWETDQETAWSLTALAEWAQAVGEPRTQFDWRLSLNRRPLLGGTATPQGESQFVRLPDTALAREAVNELQVERGRGEGRLFYAAHLRLFVPVESALPVNRGLFIARKYESADCTPQLQQPCPALERARIGQRVRVRLIVVAPTDLHFVRVTDYLPAGAEPIDPALRTAPIQNPPDVFPLIGDIWWWRGWFGRSQVYDDRVTFFARSLPAGTYELTYLFEPSLEGRYQVIPAIAEQEYFPEVFGRSAGSVLVIER